MEQLKFGVHRVSAFRAYERLRHRRLGQHLVHDFTYRPADGLDAGRLASGDNRIE
jgi:hypothetical protein